MNPTTLQKVLRELGAVYSFSKVEGELWKLPRLNWFISNIEDDAGKHALIIAEIEEALREEGIREFGTTYQDNDNVRALIYSGEEEGSILDVGNGSTKLAAWCDLFLRYRGVKG